MATKTEYLKTLITTAGGDASSLPDNLESTHYKALIEALANGTGGGGTSGGGDSWALISDITLTENIATISIDLEKPVRHLLVKGEVIGDGTNRTLTFFIDNNFVAGNNTLRFENILRTDTNMSYFAIYVDVYPELVKGMCQYYLYNPSIGANNPLFSASDLNHQKLTGVDSLNSVNFACWNNKGGSTAIGIFGNGSKFKIYGR